MVTRLPIAIMNHDIPQNRLDEQWQTNREVLNYVLWWFLQPIPFKHNPSTDSGYYHQLCADRNFRRCTPVLAALIADCPWNSDLHYL